jgi:hypothetical protein
VLSAGALWYGLSVKPAYWPPPDRTRADVRQAAERFEQALRAYTRSAQVEWTADVPQDELNRWLAVRVTEWGVNRGVHARVLDLMSRSMVNVDLDGAEVGMPFRWMGISGVLRLRYKPSAGPDRRVRMAVQSARAGLVPLPVSMAVEGILARLGIGDEAEVERLRARARSIDIVVPLRDGRKIGVADLTPLPGKFVMTCRTQGS